MYRDVPVSRHFDESFCIIIPENPDFRRCHLEGNLDEIKEEIFQTITAIIAFREKLLKKRAEIKVLI